MRADVEHSDILHEHVVILSIETQPVPYVADADRVEIDDLGYADDGSPTSPPVPGTASAPGVG